MTSSKKRLLQKLQHWHHITLNWCHRSFHICYISSQILTSSSSMKVVLGKLVLKLINLWHLFFEFFFSNFTYFFFFLFSMKNKIWKRLLSATHQKAKTGKKPKFYFATSCLVTSSFATSIKNEWIKYMTKGTENVEEKIFIFTVDLKILFHLRIPFKKVNKKRV